MIVFLLLVIIAILLLGADAIMGFAAGLFRFAGAILVMAIVMGVAQGVPGWAWAILGGVFAVLLLGVLILAAQGHADMEAGRKAQAERLARYRNKL